MGQIDRQAIERAKRFDPFATLERWGYCLKKDGARHVSLRDGKDEIARGTFKDGSWVWCGKAADGIGDNIALVRHLRPDLSFRDAVETLDGRQLPSDIPRTFTSQDNQTQKFPKLPVGSADDRDEGRRYLMQERSISLETLKHSEACGMLRYCGNGVLFTGMDELMRVRSATKRMLVPEVSEDGKTRNKRDFFGSDKTYPAVIKGVPSEVHLVEGGVSALALRDLFNHMNRPEPTIIVTGGARVNLFFDNPAIVEKLRTAENVFVWQENESRPDIQAKTDLDHEKQIQRIITLRCNSEEGVFSGIPPEGIKDLADWNSRTKKIKSVETCASMHRQPSMVM